MIWLSVPSQIIPRLSSLPLGAKDCESQKRDFVSAKYFTAGPILISKSAVSKGNFIVCQADGGTRHNSPIRFHSPSPPRSHLHAGRIHLDFFNRRREDYATSCLFDLHLQSSRKLLIARTATKYFCVRPEFRRPSPWFPKIREAPAFNGCQQPQVALLIDRGRLVGRNFKLSALLPLLTASR